MSVVLMSTQLLISQVADAQGKNAGRRGIGAPAASRTSPGPKQRTGGETAAVPRGEARVFDLKYAAAADVANIIRRVSNLSAIAEDRYNRIIVVATEDQIPAVQGLIAKLDTPPPPPEDESDFEIVLLKNRSARDLAAYLSDTFNSRHSRPLNVVADETRAALLLRGASSILDRCRKVIGELDRPAPTANLEFVFFSAKRSADSSSSTIPPDLKELSGDLRRFGRVELVGRLSTVATQGEKFQIVGRVSNLLGTDIEGRLVAATADSVKVALQSRMSLTRPAVPRPAADETEKEVRRPSGRPPEFYLNTVIAMKRGDYVLLGSAPNGWAPGESAILALYAAPVQQSAR
ncbi:MAG: secretin N-terminal domain-containing protein [Phycisphaerae bacterium]